MSSKAWIDKSDIAERLREIARMAESGYIGYLEEEAQDHEIELIIKVKESRDES